MIKTTLSSEEQKDISNESKLQHKEFCQNLKNDNSEKVKQINDDIFEIETIDDDSNSEVSDSSESDEDENRYIPENVDVEIPKSSKVKEVDKVQKVANVQKTENVNDKNIQNRPNIVLTHKQKQYLRIEKYKKQLRRNLANQSSRNDHKCHCHNACCSVISNFQGVRA
ncbi:hypothetical protein LXL04_039591 [Taraxacum kok-saghyz]